MDSLREFANNQVDSGGSFLAYAGSFSLEDLLDVLNLCEKNQLIEIKLPADKLRTKVSGCCSVL